MLLLLLLRELLDERDGLTLLPRLLLLLDDEREVPTLLLRLLLDDEREEFTLLLLPRLLLDERDVLTLLLRPPLLLLFIVVRLFVVVPRPVFMSVLRLLEVRDVTLLGVSVLLPFTTTLLPLFEAMPRRLSLLLVAPIEPPYRLSSLPGRLLLALYPGRL